MSNFRKTNENIWLRYINISGDGTCRKEDNFFAEESNIFPERPLYSVGYIKLNIPSGRRH